MRASRVIIILAIIVFGGVEGTLKLQGDFAFQRKGGHGVVLAVARFPVPYPIGIRFDRVDRDLIPRGEKAKSRIEGYALYGLPKADFASLFIVVRIVMVFKIAQIELLESVLSFWEGAFFLGREAIPI